MTKKLLLKENLILSQIMREEETKEESKKGNPFKIAVLMGGMSSERAISFESGKGVLKALLDKGYTAFALDVCQPLSALIRMLEIQRPDVVFNALHGKYGEDGCIQGLLNMLHIPYTHSGVLASALSMDKQRTKEVAQQLGIDVAKGQLMTKEELLNGSGFDFPYVVKPNDEGSSVGVYIVKNKEEAEKMFSQWPFQKCVLVEEYIPGKELSVAVMDDGPLGTVDIIPKMGFYDYQNKYSEGAATHVIPAHLSASIEEKILTDAFHMHKALGCRGISRSDFRYDMQTGRVVFLELNANPGMTPLSLVPEIAAKKGINYANLVELLIQKADYER